MPRRLRTLGVWIDGAHVADVEERRWNKLMLRYTEQALERFPRNSPLVSCSLPLDDRPRDATAFLAGLLPEGHALQMLAMRASVTTNNVFDLLERYGRDIAGALVFADQPPDPDRYDLDAYGPDGLEQAVDELGTHPLGVHDDSELSLAGLQEKLLLVRTTDGAWARPTRGRPSTHILKVDDRLRPGLVAAQAEGLKLARALGLTERDHELIKIGPVDCLVVERFDRRTDDTGQVRRVHQEDLCQALGVSHLGPGGRGKYEFGGGPGFKDAARLLETYAADRSGQLDRLVAAATFTVAIGNADAHAKNLALLHPDLTSVELAPLYDTVPTALWPKLRKTLSMHIAGKSAMTQITIDDLAEEAREWRHSARRTREVAADTLDRLEQSVADGVIDPDGPLGSYVSARCAEMRGRDDTHHTDVSGAATPSPP